MKIYSGLQQSHVLCDAVLTQAAEHEEELMKSDFIKLSWDSDEYIEFPVDSYIIPYNDGVRYRLMEPYKPEHKGADGWHYEPHFQHPKMYLGKVLFDVDTQDAEGNPITLIDWSYTGFIGNLLGHFIDKMNKAFGIGGNMEPAFELNTNLGDTKDIISISFNSVDIISALNQLANQLECEWHIYWNYFAYSHLLQIGGALYLDPNERELIVGENVTPPSQKDSKEGFYNVYQPQGSTRNMSKRISSGAFVQSNVRLDIKGCTCIVAEGQPEVTFEDGKIYTDGHGNVISKQNFDTIGIREYIKPIIIEEVYPKTDLYVYDVRCVERYLLEEGTNNKVVDHYDGNTPVYRKYAIWYIRLADATGKDYDVQAFAFAKVTKVITKEDGYAAFVIDLPWSSVSDCLVTLHVGDEDSAELTYVVEISNGGYHVNAWVMKDAESGNCAVRCRYSSESDDRYDSDEEEIRNFINTIAVGQTIDFDSGINRNGFPSGNTSGMSKILEGKKPIIAFQNNKKNANYDCPLAGLGDGDGNGHYGFEVHFHTSSSKAYDEIKDEYIDVKKGDYEIIFQQNDNLILPTTKAEGIIPKGPSTMTPEVGNKVSMYNVFIDSSLVSAAQMELAQQAWKEIATEIADQNNYTVRSFPDVFEEYNDINPGDALFIGKRVRLKSRTQNLSTRVIKLVTKVDFPFEQEITVGNKIIKGTRQQILEKVDGFISSGGFAGGSGKGGGVSTSTISGLIESLGAQHFLSKKKDDTAQGTIRFLKGVQVGQRFRSGLGGYGGVFRKEGDGRTYIEADEIYIRMKAYFDTVEIREYQHSSGNRVASSAGIKCTEAVPYGWLERLNTNVPLDAEGYYHYTDDNGEEQTELVETVKFYRCYFRIKDDDNTITNDFRIGDMARCHTTNVVGNSLRMQDYWRMVIGKNGSHSYASQDIEDDDYGWIDLSNESNTNPFVATDRFGKKVVCYNYMPGSGIPLAEDDIYQYGNVLEEGRQGAIVEYVNGTNAPSYCIYQEIGKDPRTEQQILAQDVYNPFVFDDTAMVELGYDSQKNHAYMNVFGDAYIGAKDESSYIKYDQENHKVTIKGDLQIGTTIGGQDLRTVIQNNTWSEEDILSLIRGITDLIQNQVDGSIETWFYNGTPGPSVLPESQWVSKDTQNGNNNERIKHLGDLYYDNESGRAYRYVNKETNPDNPPIFEWQEISDSAIIKALEDAKNAQDTADGKRRVFVIQPPVTDKGYVEYDVGDLWVNADGTFNYYDENNQLQSVTYHKDLLYCRRSKPLRDSSGNVINSTEAKSFSINDWGLASQYVNEEAFSTFLQNYNSTLTKLYSQIDKKAQTWYQEENPAVTDYTTGKGWKDDPNDSNANHVGDLWYCLRDHYYTSGPHTGEVQYGKKTTWHFTEDNGSYYWEQQEIPDDVFDKIDGKCQIYVNSPNTPAQGAEESRPVGYHQYDLWILSNAISKDTDNGYNGPDYIKGEVLTAKNDMSSSGFSWNDWEKKVGYTDDSRLESFIDQILNGNHGTENSDDTAGYAIHVIKQALQNVSSFKQGLILTSLIGMRHLDESNHYRVWSGISGIYEANETGNRQDPEGEQGTTVGFKGHGIAAWYGGGMRDYELMSDRQKEEGWDTWRWAKSLFRFDGSGYVASGNISWDSVGAVTIKSIQALYATLGTEDTNILDEVSLFSKMYALSEWNIGSGVTEERIHPKLAYDNLLLKRGTGYAINDNSVLSYAETKQNFISLDAFKRLFTIWLGDANNTEGDVTDRFFNGETINGTISIKANYGLWTEKFLSALGINPNGSSGGGTGDGDVTWEALSQFPSGSERTIAWGYISDAVNSQHFLKEADLSTFATKEWVENKHYLQGITYNMVTTALGFTPFDAAGFTKGNIEGLFGFTLNGTGASYNLDNFITGHQTIYALSIYGENTKVTDFIPNSANASIYIKAGGNISLTNDTTNKSITLSYSHPTAMATTISAADKRVLSAITVNNLGHVISVSSKTLAAADIPDISADYATSGRVDTLEGYFTNGVANNAARLTTVSKTAWGRTYWTANGVPESISGDMTGVDNITMSEVLHMANGKFIEFKDNTNNSCNVFTLNGSNNLAIGYGSRKRGYVTDIQGGFFKFATNNGKNGDVDDRLEVMEITSAGQVQVKQGRQGLVVGNGIDGSYIQIGDIRIEYVSAYNALKVYKKDGTTDVAANLYALGGVSALGYSPDQSGGGGGTGDVTWDALRSTPADSTRKIHWGYISDALANRYLPLNGGTVSGDLTVAGNLIIGTNIAATRSWVSSSYLPLTGGTISALSGNSPLTIKPVSGQSSYINFADSNGNVMGKIGVNNGVPRFYNQQTSMSYDIWHYGNFPVYIGTPSNGQVLKYNSTNSRFEPSSDTAGSGTVTSITAGTGLSGGTITGSGTIAISQTYIDKINHGESAYNSLSSYLPLSAGSSYPLTGHLYLSADKDIRLYQDSTHYAYIRPDSADGLTIGFSSGSANQLNLPANTFMGSSEVATHNWVQSQGYLTSVSDGNPTLSWGTKSTVATIGGTAIHVTLPSNPNTDHYDWSDITNKPSTFAPSSHTHSQYLESGALAGYVTSSGLSTALSNYSTTSHTHTLSIATDSGTNALTLSANTKYKLTAGGKTFIFTTPTDTNTWRPIGTGASDAAAGNHTHSQYVESTALSNYVTSSGLSTALSNYSLSTHTHTWANITSKPTSKGGTTTPIYIDSSGNFQNCTAYGSASVNYANSAGSVAWNNVTGKPTTFTPSSHTHSQYLESGALANYVTSDDLSNALSNYSLSTHTHPLSIAADSGTNALTLSANTKYKLTAGGKTFIFTTPADTNTWRPIGTGASDAAAGNHNHDGTYLKLSGGTLTGHLIVATGAGIKDASGNALLAYHSAVTGATSSQWFVGANDCQGVIRSSNTDLIHYKGSNSYNILDSSNSSVSLDGSTLTVKINGVSKSLTNTNTTYESKAAVSGGTAVSLVTTGEKYTWNNKTSLTIGTTATTAAAGNHTHSQYVESTTLSNYVTSSGLSTALSNYSTTSHTHSLSIAADSGTNALTLSANTKYKLTAGGKTFIFTTPADTNTWRPIGTGASDAAAGNHTHSQYVESTALSNYVTSSGLSTALGNYSLSTHTHTLSIAADSGTNALTMAANTKYKLTAGGKTFIFTTPPDANSTYSFSDKDVTLAWGTRKTVATVGGTDIHITLPSNPNTDHYDWSDITNKPSTFAPSTHTHSQYLESGALAGYVTSSGLSTALSNYSTTSHTHTLSIAADSGTNALTLAANTKYKLTAGGKTFIFTTPADTNTTYSFTDKNVTLEWNTQKTIATVGGTDIHVTLPSNPNSWRTIQCNGTSIGSNTLNLKAGTNVSLTNSNGTITIASTDTNTWRGIQDNLTSSTNTTESLSAKQGYLLANGSARDNTKLPLSGGTLTGHLIVATGAGIKDASGNALLAYHSAVTGATSSQWFVGASDCQGAIRSSNTDLMHARGATQYVILDSANYTSYAAAANHSHSGYAAANHTHSNYVPYNGDSGIVTEGYYIDSADGGMGITNDGGDLNIYTEGGDVVVDNNLFTNGKITVESGGLLVSKGLAEFKDNINVYYGGVKRLYFYTPSTNVNILQVAGYGVFSNTVTASNFITSSDTRKKDIIDYDANIDLWSIAYAPAIHFTWKNSDDRSVQVGSIAQYWNKVFPDVVKQDHEGYLSMQYDILALLSAISIAKKTIDHERRISELERENKLLREEIENLKAA